MAVEAISIQMIVSTTTIETITIALPNISAITIAKNVTMAMDVVTIVTTDMHQNITHIIIRDITGSTRMVMENAPSRLSWDGFVL